jgi:gag-polypeptide of LTR copia-type
MSQDGIEISSPKLSKTITLSTNFLDALTDKITKMVLQTTTPSSTSVIASPSAKITIFEELNQTLSIKFDGKNYWLWAQTVNIYLDSKKKVGYITRKIKMPKGDDAEFER